MHFFSLQKLISTDTLLAFISGAPHSTDAGFTLWRTGIYLVAPPIFFYALDLPQVLLQKRLSWLMGILVPFWQWAPEPAFRCNPSDHWVS